MASTYEKIGTTTTSGSATNYTFSSIPATFTDLVMVISGTNSGGGAEDLRLEYNGDTSTNYSRTFIEGTTSAVASSRNQNLANAAVGGYIGPSNYFTTIVNLLNYSNTTTYKTSLSRANIPQGATYGLYATVNVWRSTAAITSIKVFWPSMSFGNGSTITLYGIKAA